MRDFFRTRWVLLLIIFAAVGSVGAFVLRLLTPRQLVVPRTDFITTSQTSGSTSFSNIRFTGTAPAIPQNLPFALIQPSQTTLDYVRSQLIARYNLSQVTSVDGLWQSETHTLSYDPHGDKYLFYAKNIPEEGLLESSFQAIEQAQVFVRQTFPNLSFTASREGVMYFDGLDELDLTTPENASALEIPFTYTIEGIPLYLGHARTAPISIIMNYQNEMQKVVFQPGFFDFVPAEGRAEVVGLDVALENINNKNEAVVVGAYEEETGVFSLDQIRSGELTAVRLEYRADVESGFAYPFYRFTGTLVNQDGQTINAEIITPAVAVQQ